MEYGPLPTSENLSALADELSNGGSIQFVRRIEGGTSCTTDVIQLTERSGAERKLVLRRLKPTDTAAAASMEFDAMSFLFAQGAAVPEPLWFGGADIFDSPVVVMSYIDGSSQTDELDIETQAERMALALAKMHDVPIDDGFKDTFRDNARVELEKIAGQPTAKVAAHPLGKELWVRMQTEAERVVFGGPVFTHGGFWRGNTLWKQGQPVAIVDFEDCGIGDPAADVAGAMNDLRLDGQQDAATRFLETYRAATGRGLDSLDYWLMHELRRPMPDVASWLPTFKAINGAPSMTAEVLRARHTALIEGFISG